MSGVKAISNSELAALANRLRLTLIRDRMEEMLGLAAEKRLSPRETLEFFLSTGNCAQRRKPNPTGNHGGSFSSREDIG